MNSEHNQIRRYTDGSEWQELAGYSRAVRIGQLIAVSGTTASHADGSAQHVGDTYRQTLVALELALDAVNHCGGSPDQVIRSRVYLTPDAFWRDAARAHKEVFGAAPPANTMLYVAGLIGDGLLVEVELEALVTGDPR